MDVSSVGATPASPDRFTVDADGRRLRRPYIVALVILACALAGRIVFLSQPVNSDTAMFVYMGKLVTDGKQIGVDLVDNKLPSVGLIMSTPYRLIGDAWWGYTLLGIAMMTLAPLLLARAAGRAIGRDAFIPVLLAAAVWMNFSPMVYGLFQLETIQTFFVVLGACSVLNMLTRYDWRDAVTAGLCVGVGMWAKPTAAAILPAIALAIWVGTDWRVSRKLVAMMWGTIGVLIPTALCAWLLMVTGMLDPLPATLAQLREYSANSTAEWIDLVKPLFAIGVMLFPVVVWGYVFRRDKTADATRLNSSKSGVAPTARHAIVIFAIAWLIMETIGVVSQRRMYAYHFLPMGAPAALIVGLFLRRARVASIAFAFGPFAVMSCIFVMQIMSWPDRQARMSEVIAYLERNAGANDGVWLDDYPRLMVETDLQPGSRVPLTFLFGNSDEAPLRFSQMIVDDLRDRRPDWVVLHHDRDRFVDFYQTYMAEMAAYPQRRENFARGWGAIDDYVRQNYVVETHIDGLDILKRSDAVAHAE